MPKNMKFKLKNSKNIRENDFECKITKKNKMDKMGTVSRILTC